MTTIKSFHDRLAKIGIEVGLVANYPWIYLNTVNNKYVLERYQADHGFTVFFTAIRLGEEDKMTDIRTIFKKIRQMLSEEGRLEDRKAWLEWRKDYNS